MNISIVRYGLLRGLVAAVATALVAATHSGTGDRIAGNQRLAEARVLLEIAPHHDNSLLDDVVMVTDARLLGLRAPQPAYIARLQGKAVAVILPTVARDGYGGDIHLIVGINLGGGVTGVRVLSHRETAGLGDWVDRGKSDWVEQFAGKALGAPPAERWAVKKDQGVFDQFTGATTTPRAVIGAVRRALQYFAEQRDRLLSETTEHNHG
jgi:electron transport complex protein RnfG